MSRKEEPGFFWPAVICIIAMILAVTGCQPRAKQARLKTFVPQAAMPNGNLLVVMTKSHKVKNVIEVTPAGNVVKRFSVPGQEVEEINVSAGGTVFLLVDRKHVFRKRAQDKGFKSVRISQGGSERWTKGLFSSGMAVDSDDNIYLPYDDDGWSTILKISPAGRFIRRWKVNGFVDGAPGIIGNEKIASDPKGQIHVLVDSSKGHTLANRIVTFTADGEKLRSWGDFRQAISVAVDRAGNLYIADKRSKKRNTTIYINKFNAGGRLLRKRILADVHENSFDLFQLSIVPTKKYVYVVIPTTIFKISQDGKLVAKWPAKNVLAN